MNTPKIRRLAVALLSSAIIFGGIESQAKTPRSLNVNMATWDVNTSRAGGETRELKCHHFTDKVLCVYKNQEDDLVARGEMVTFMKTGDHWDGREVYTTSGNIANIRRRTLGIRSACAPGFDQCRYFRTISAMPVINQIHAANTKCWQEKRNGATYAIWCIEKLSRGRIGPNVLINFIEPHPNRWPFFYFLAKIDRNNW